MFKCTYMLFRFIEGDRRGQLRSKLWVQKHRGSPLTCAGGLGNSSHSGENFWKDSLTLITKALEGLATVFQLAKNCGYRLTCCCVIFNRVISGADLGGGCRGCTPPPLR